MTALTSPTSLTTSPSDYAVRVEELGRMIAAYSELTEKLRQSHDQLTRTVQTLRQELGEKNRLLERKNRLAALGEMAGGMAHEIRNPLGGIQLYASLLAKDVADRPDSLQLVHKIAGGVRRLEALVGRVLQFTREINPVPAPTDLAQVVDQAVEYASQAMSARGLRCQVRGQRPMPVTADEALLGQALLNLLLNAAEAMGHAANTDGNRDVRVTYTAPPGDSLARQFHLVVQDAGPGVPPGVMDQVFNPFFTTKDTGTGLGLSIVHRVVEAHDGTVLVTNPPEGGARFEIRI